MNGRIIAIGDIHGCHQEFAELLARLELTKDDRLILVGDLINRGPDSCKVIDLARQHRAISLLGNHELRLLTYRKDKTPVADISRETDADTFQKLRAEDWAYLEAMPLTHSHRRTEHRFRARRIYAQRAVATPAGLDGHANSVHLQWQALQTRRGAQRSAVG
jgi:Icc-related predicted phosphoesterase